jgi:hypothetical protein
MEDEKLPPFPKGERTGYGFCLREAFTIGEWQNKCYQNALKGDWSTSEENAEGIIHTEDQMQKSCGVDVRRSKFYMDRALSAIKQKDFRKLEKALLEHDTEILTAMEVSEKCKI